MFFRAELKVSSAFLHFSTIMKKFLIIICLSQHFYAVSQNQNKLSFGDYNSHLIINLGAISHFNNTVSQNNNVAGLSTIDMSPSLRLVHYFKNRKNALSIGGELNSFTNKFKTRSGYYEDYDGEFRSFVSSSFYYKIGIHYNYFIEISNRINIGTYIGPCYIHQIKEGLYDYYSWYSEIRENNVLLYTFENKFTAQKVNRQTLGAQFGCTFHYLFSKRHLLLLNVGYTVGFKNNNQTNVEVLVNNITTDSGIIYSKGNGVSLSIGLSVPLNL